MLPRQPLHSRHHRLLPAASDGPPAPIPVLLRLHPGLPVRPVSDGPVHRGQPEGGLRGRRFFDPMGVDHRAPVHLWHHGVPPRGTVPGTVQAVPGTRTEVPAVPRDLLRLRLRVLTPDGRLVALPEEPLRPHRGVVLDQELGPRLRGRGVPVPADPPVHPHPPPHPHDRQCPTLGLPPPPLRCKECPPVRPGDQAPEGQGQGDAGPPGLRQRGVLPDRPRGGDPGAVLQGTPAPLRHDRDVRRGDPPGEAGAVGRPPLLPLLPQDVHMAQGEDRGEGVAGHLPGEEGAGAARGDGADP